MMEQNMNFEAAISRLEEITLKIEDPNTPIEESVELYKEAAALIRTCAKTIDEAELQVKSVLQEGAGDPQEAL